MMPTNVAARMTLAADPESLQGAVAAGILGAGPVVLGTSEECARLLEAAQSGGERRGAEAVAATWPRADLRRRRQRSRVRPPRSPAGRPARREDPRAGRRPRRQRAARRACARLRDAVAEVWGKPLTMNVAMPIAAVMLDLGLLPSTREGRPDPRAHGRPARPPGRGAASIPSASAWPARPRRRSSTSRRRPMLAPEVETRPWAEQLASTMRATAPSSRTSSTARRSTARS